MRTSLLAKIAKLERKLASLPFNVYGLKGVKHQQFTDRDEFIKAMQSHGIHHNGDNERGRPEMHGAPKFKGLLGPMWDGDRGLRYETQEVYDELST